MIKRICNTPDNVACCGAIVELTQLRELLKVEPNVCSKCGFFLGLLAEVGCPSCETRYLETVKNHSDRAMVEFLEAKETNSGLLIESLEKLNQSYHDCKEKAQADSKRLMDGIMWALGTTDFGKDAPTGRFYARYWWRKPLAKMCGLAWHDGKYITQKALIDTEGEKGGAWKTSCGE